MHRKSFYRIERILNSLGLYRLFQDFIDRKIIKKPNYTSDLLKFSTVNFLVRHFIGYIGHEANSETASLGFGILHYAFITVTRPERILCVGSQQGYIPAVCAMACKDAGSGHVDFVDAGYDTDKLHSWGGTGFWKKNDPDQHFSPFGLNRYITTHVMTSEKFARTYRRKYEYIYIDGDHTYEGVKTDFRLFWPRLAANGIMSFHDIALKGLSRGEEYGVWKLWKELGEANKISIIIRENGVGFIQKLE